MYSLCGVCEGIWHLLATSVKKHDVIYELEPDVKYAQIEFTLHLDRKPLYYIVNIILPCCLLIVISFLVSLSALFRFWTQKRVPNGHERCYPSPIDRGTGYCFRSISLFFC